MALVSKDVLQQGCTIYSLNGMPYDGDENEYTKAQYAMLEKQLAGLTDRAYVCSVNSYQKKAKKLLEEHGFKVLARTYTAHIAGNQKTIDKWKETKDNENTIYLMGRKFFRKVKENAKKSN